QVHAQLLGKLDVVLQRLVGRRGVKPVRPEALVERAVLEDELVVEEDAGDAFVVLAEGDLAHAEVGLRNVVLVTLTLKVDSQTLQEWLVWRPKLGARNLEHELLFSGNCPKTFL